MRGPLLSGAVGSQVTLRRVVELLRGHSPVAVLGSAWLGALEVEGPVQVLAAPSDLPSAPPAGALLIENLRARAAVGATGALAQLLLTVASSLAPGGKVLALDRARPKDVALEAQLATAFLAAGFRDIIQTRPRPGALITAALAPEPLVRQALARVLGAASVPDPGALGLR